jgi:hypothetical protein
MPRSAGFLTLRVLPLSAALTLLSGCAGSGGLSGAESVAPMFRNNALSAQSAQSSLVIGKTTKAETLDALGPATVIKFDSGYEVWAYRSAVKRSRDAGAELVILFTSAGVVQKSRVRPAPETVLP